VRVLLSAAAPRFSVEVVLLKGGRSIRGMLERARRIGGDLTIHSSPGDGTRVTLTISNASRHLAITTKASNQLAD